MGDGSTALPAAWAIHPHRDRRWQLRHHHRQPRRLSTCHKCCSFSARLPAGGGNTFGVADDDLRPARISTLRLGVLDGTDGDVLRPGRHHWPARRAHFQSQPVLHAEAGMGGRTSLPPSRPTPGQFSTTRTLMYDGDGPWSYATGLPAFHSSCKPALHCGRRFQRHHRLHLATAQRRYKGSPPPFNVMVALVIFRGRSLQYPPASWSRAGCVSQ